jgi:hypothetical protein
LPTDVRSAADLRPGDIYEDCAYHPCLCVRIEDDDVEGISLVDGSFPRSCSIQHCGVRRLSPAEAWEWRLNGPADTEVPPERRWWDRAADREAAS